MIVDVHIWVTEFWVLDFCERKKGGLAVLIASHCVGAPFIFLALYLPDPICFDQG